MSQKVQMKCEKCGNMEHWDNRVGKTNPKAPDYRCTQCKNGVWPEKNSSAAQQAQPVQHNGYAGPHVPAMDGQYAPPAPPVVPQPTAPDMFTSYTGITDWVLGTIAPRYAAANVGLSPEAAAACIHTLFIAQQKKLGNVH